MLTVSQLSKSFAGRVLFEDVSLQVNRGDRVGLVGPNGAGKTTLLRVMAGIYEPVVGTVKSRGRISPMFDIGLGIDTEISGYENIRMRGLILGMTPQEIEAQMQDITEARAAGANFYLVKPVAEAELVRHVCVLTGVPL